MSAYKDLALETLAEQLLIAERARDEARAMAGWLWRRLVQTRYELEISRRQLLELRQASREDA